MQHRYDPPVRPAVVGGLLDWAQRTGPPAVRTTRRGLMTLARMVARLAKAVAGLDARVRALEDRQARSPNSNDAALALLAGVLERQQHQQMEVLRYMSQQHQQQQRPPELTGREMASAARWMAVAVLAIVVLTGAWLVWDFVTGGGDAPPVGPPGPIGIIDPRLQHLATQAEEAARQLDDVFATLSAQKEEVEQLRQRAEAMPGWCAAAISWKRLRNYTGPSPTVYDGARQALLNNVQAVRNGQPILFRAFANQIQTAQIDINQARRLANTNELLLKDVRAGLLNQAGRSNPLAGVN